MPPEIDEIDCWLTDAIVCPYCGFEFGDCWEFGDSGRVDCDSCGQDFEFEAEHSVRYTSRKRLKICQRCLRGNGVAKGEVETMDEEEK